MKTIVLVLVLFSTATFAKEKERSPASSIPASVKELANKIRKNEVRTRISSYEVSEDEASPCSEAGIHYNIKLQIKKAIRTLDKNENVVIKHVWETVREIDTDVSGRPMEICAE